MSVDSVGVLPWLAIRETIVVGPITFYRADAVASLVGDRTDVLVDRLNIYKPGWDGMPVHPTVAIHHDQLSNGGHIPYDDLRRAVDVLTIASIFDNDGLMGEQNSTTFTLEVLELGGAVGFTATSTRRRAFGIVAGATTDNDILKPTYSGYFRSYNRMMRDALVAARPLPADLQGRLFDSLAWFRRASTDATNIDEDVDLVLMLTGVDFLLAHTGTSGAGLDYDRIKVVLSNFETIPCCGFEHKGKRFERSQIESVLRVLNETRNATVHPRVFHRDEKYAFEMREKPRFIWVADRCFMALLVARLCELGVFPDADFAQAFVAGVEAWIFDPTRSVTFALPEIVLDTKIQIVRRDKAKLQTYTDSRSDEAVMNEAERSWGTDFRIALGAVPPPWRVTLKWLDQQSGVIAVSEEVDGEQEVFPMRVNLDEPPARTAFSVHALFQRDGVPSKEHEFSEKEIEALRDPGKWLSGGTHPG